MCTHTKITETGAKRLVFGVLCPLSPAVRWWFQTVDDFSLGMVDVLVFWVHCVALKTRVLHDNCLTLDTFTQKLKTHHFRQRRMNIIQHHSGASVILGHYTSVNICLQCYDTVGWLSGRASGLQKVSDEVLALLSDANGTPSSLASVKSRLV